MAAEWICRALRDGGSEGEHAPGLTIKESIITSPLGFHVFTHFLSHHSTNISAAKSQSRGLVLVAFSRSPSFYLDLLSKNGLQIASSHHCIAGFGFLIVTRILMVWKNQMPECDSDSKLSPDRATVCRNVKDVDSLLSSIISLGRGFVGQGKDRFCVAIDSINEMLRYASLSSVASLIGSLRCYDQISSIFWFLNEVLCEGRATCTLEYMSSMVASIEPLIQFANGQRSNSGNFSSLDQNFGKGKLHLRCKRRNGRVRVMFEEIHIGQSGINFTSISFEDGVINQGLVPKVQFNLRLSEKELRDRANVVLPFEHQGNGKPVQIYDGRKSLTDSKYEVASVPNGNSEIDKKSKKGEIIYYRDSEDEMPDSDEDPDDDLDI